jgi:hypothetical protein
VQHEHRKNDTEPATAIHARNCTPPATAVIPSAREGSAWWLASLSTADSSAPKARLGMTCYWRDCLWQSAAVENTGFSLTRGHAHG